MHPLPPSINDPRYAIPVPNRPPVQPAVNLNNPAPPIPLVQPAVVPQPEAAPPQIQTVQPPADPRGAKRQRENDGPDANEPVLKAARTGDMTTSLATQQKALIAAIVDGNPEAVQALLKEQPAMRDGYLPIEYQLTPLCLAARRGSLAIVGLLIRAGAAVDQRAGNGSTPLMFAAQSGHLEVVKLLLLLQAAPEATNSLTGWTALAYACDEKQLEVCKHLISVGCDIWRNLATPNETTAPSPPTTPYIVAIKQDFASLIELLLDPVGMFAAIDPSSRNSRLVTSLSAASSCGSLSIVRMLIARGAKPDVQTNFGDGVIYKDAFHLAMASDQAHVVEYLLSTGYRPTGWGAILPETHKLTSNPRIVDLILHWQEAANPFSDGLADATIRDQPYRPIMEFAGYLASGRPGSESVAIDAWRRRGQLISMF